MPLVSGSVTFSRFDTTPEKERPGDTRRWLTKALQSGAFVPLDLERAEEDRAAGFVELEDRDATAFAAGDVIHGEYALFGYRIDAVRVPSAAVKAELGRWEAAFQKEHGRTPSRGEKAHQRDAVKHLLRKKTPPGSRVHDVALDLKTGNLQVWAASRKVVEEIAVAVETSFALKVRPVTPASLAERAGIAEDALGPTAELVGMGLSSGGSEVRRGAA
jgi:recombination associated protein RdgC